MDCFIKFYYGVFVFENDKIVGYVIMFEVVDEVMLMDIVVDSGVRGKGVGCVLVDFVIEILVKNVMCEMWLEVCESNYIVIVFYESLGFEYIEICKNYYIVKNNDDGYDKSNGNSV